MILVAMGHNDRVDRPKIIDLWYAPRRGTLAKVEEQPRFAGFEQETGRCLAADPGNEP
jgi:hypothetical protein